MEELYLTPRGAVITSDGEGLCPFWAVEDPTGMVNVVLSPDVFATSREALHGAFVLIEGIVQKDHGTLNLIGRKIATV